jgi:hypothetical protein
MDAILSTIKFKGLDFKSYYLIQINKDSII